MTTITELLQELSKRSFEKSKLIGNSISLFKYIIEWLEKNPKERILPLETIIRLINELLVKLNK